MNIHPLFPTEDPPVPQKNEKGPDFGAFWAQYPRKVAKRDAMRAWTKLRSADRLAAMQALPAHNAFWQKKFGADRSFIPHPATWLNGGRWEDELDPIVEKSKQGASVQAFAEPEWWESWSGIVQRGAELGLMLEENETPPHFKWRVYKAAGPGKWWDVARGGGSVAGLHAVGSARRGAA